MAIAMAVAVSWITSYALDLPVMTVNGTSYHYYQVKKGDTLFSLSRSLGLSRDEIIKNNPSVADGLRTGTTLYFPVRQNDTAIAHEIKKGETLFGISHKYGVTPDDIIATNPSATNGIRAGETLMIPIKQNAANTEPAKEAEETDSSSDILVHADNSNLPNDSIVSDNVDRTATVAIILPFMLSEETPSKASRRYLDFYKGFLIAADTISQRGSQIKIAAFDSEGSLDKVKSLLDNPDVKNATVIIAPEDDVQLNILTANAADNETYVINVFNFRDSAYMTNPFAWRGNIPHQQMYEKAVDAMMSEHKDAIPVLMSNAKGNNEKSEFVAYVKDRYIANGITPIEIEYDGALHQGDLEILDDNTDYVLLPSSGTVGEFNKFCYVLKSYRESLAEPNRVRLFGYPDWTAFLSDAADMLHTLDATIYTRFYDDHTSLGHRNVTDAFKRNYGTEPIEVIPNHAILGFDTGLYILKNLKENDGDFNPEYPSTYRGVQSSLTMIPYYPSSDETVETGYYNNALYIVRFMPGKYVTTKVM